MFTSSEPTSSSNLGCFQPVYTCAHQSRNLPSWAALLGEAGTCRTLLKWPSELEAGFENLNLGTCKAGEVQVVWILCLVSTALSRLLSIRDDFGYLFVVFMMLCIFRSKGWWGASAVAGTPRNSLWETSSRFIVWWVFGLLDFFFTKYCCLFGFFFHSLLISYLALFRWSVDPCSWKECSASTMRINWSMSCRC